MDPNKKEKQVNSNITNTLDSLEKSYHRNLPIDEFLTYLTSSQKKTSANENVSFVPKKSPRGSFSTGNYYELKNQMMPESYVVTTSNNNLTYKKESFKQGNLDQDDQKQSDTDSSALEISIKVDQEDSQMDLHTSNGKIQFFKDGIVKKNLFNISGQSKSPKNHENSKKVSEMSSITQKTNQHLYSERTQSHTDFRLTDRTKTLSIPFQVSGTTNSSHNSEQENEVYMQEDLNSVCSKNPFCRSGQIYQHSSHIKSLDSNSSDDYDNEGTSSKRKKINQVRDLQQNNLSLKPSTRLYKNMFNDSANPDIFNIKRSLPNASVEIEKLKNYKVKQSRDSIDDNIAPYFFKAKQTLKCQKEDKFGYYTEKISNIQDDNDSSDKENSYYHSAVHNNNINIDNILNLQDQRAGLDQFDNYLVNNNIDLTSIKKKDHNSIPSSVKFSSVTNGMEF